MRFPVRATSLAALLLLGLGCSDGDAEKQRYFENGNRLAREKRYNEAIVEYRNAIAVDDKFAEARVGLAEVLVDLGNVDAANREYQRAADLVPDNLAVQKRAATLLFMAGQFQDVRSRVQEVLRKNPKDADAQVLYANALVGLRDLEGGLTQIEQAIAIDPGNASIHTNLALLKLAQGDRAAAEAAFQKGVELDPKSLKARLALTYFYLSTGNAPQAELSLREGLALDPNDPLANRALAAIYLATGREAEAEKPLRLVADITKSARAQFALADYYVRVKRMNDATALLEPLAKSPRTRAEAETRLAHVVYESGNKEQGKKLLDAVLAREPNIPGALLQKSRWLLADGRPVQALERATAAVNLIPRDAPAIYYRGTLQALLGQREAAARSFNEVMRMNPRAAAAQVQLAQLSLRAGDSAHAVDLAREAVARNRATPEARLVLARALIADNELSRAEAELESLLKAYPRAAGVQAARGTLELIRGNTTAARQAFQAAFDADPTSIAALGGLSMLDVQEGKVSAAKARVEKRLEAEPRRVDVLIIAARIYVAEGTLPLAERSLRQAIDLAPTLPEPYMILADLYQKQQRLEEARADFDVVAQRNPANLAARTMAAVLVHAQGKLEDAKRRYTELLEREPRAAVAANNLAWIYADERQNLDEALDLAERATKQLPDYAEAWDTLGWVYHRKQLPLLAVVPFEKAVAKDPNNATFHFHLGLALSGAGNRSRARESLQTALKLQPDFPDAQRQMTALAQ